MPIEPEKRSASAGIAGQRRRGFRQAVAFRQRAAGHRQPLFGNGLLGRHAAAERSLELGEVDLVEAGRIQKPIVKRVDGREAVDLVFRQLLDEARHVARIGDQQVDAAGAHRQQVTGRQRKDVIERQCADDKELIDMRRLFQRRLQPRIVLQHIGEDVAMEQRRALGDAGGAAGILQKGDVVGHQPGLLERHGPPRGDRIVKGDGAAESNRPAPSSSPAAPRD